MNKEIIKQNVGIDISKNDFKVCFSTMNSSFQIKIQGSHSFENSVKGFEKFGQWVIKKAMEGLAVNFTMEATGVYYESPAYYLSDHNDVVHVVLPNQSKKFGQSLSMKSKTDKIDAQIPAQMGLERELRLWKPVSPLLRILKQLTRERDGLVRERTTVSNHLHACRHQGKPCQESIQRSRKHLVFLDKQIKEIESEIRMTVQQDKTLEGKMKYLISIPGVGLLTAVTIVAETNGFVDITNVKQLASFSGLDVKIVESGTWKGKSKISKKGNSHIRKALFMPAFSKIKKDHATNEYYNRLKQAKGKGMIAAVAVQRKLLGLMFTLWKNEEMFKPAV